MRSILSAIKNDYPDIKFKVGDQYYWSPSLKTVFYVETEKNDPNDRLLLIHELAHALLNHTNYEKDVDLLKMEREAWKETSNLGDKYNIEIDDNTVEQAIDSYRDWLHSRSICPSCGAIGHETKDKIYKCIACGSRWKPNEARTCGLRRYKITSE